ncbi:3-phosphoshikimate 1-carboxyvinyltransferase [Sulfurihydrogenibium azorense Az-Fu1]|jgi:3-phosphoshikimate 1-carboxyvinyltransferase|uniref:3-phosphoshikimate 1-carboxyvinyltransferase n=1 Tax=Sulfurihydrogenibium azorense (strain DSM 15241 / OCM 825 / Az-Fu1) TaxID=204536 RepID=C1DV21_SULAA|nr:3-phosphoshikimate 1-carboxyvinyltransferase [Sulfurihydrogenibium azorense]ACN98673.1 3-phosphoshikimate 1-carboxyvinyltransferase [Sulfurihydrogenibium azorense Az-Fu1]
MEKTVKPVKRIEGSLRVPSDKSVSHRSIILPSLAEGESVIKNFLKAGDTLTTLNVYRKLGVDIEEKDNVIYVKGKGLEGLKEPDDVLDMGNSGTTTRLTLGVLAGQNFFATLTGDDSLRKRPMKRVVDPLSEMGAKVDGRKEANNLPISIRGGKLKGISYFNSKMSAQVKSAILLAGLYAETPTEVVEPIVSRDHTEKMLNWMGANIEIDFMTDGYKVKISKTDRLKPIHINVPADPSSAAFFAAAASIVPKSEIILKDVMVNPTRDGFFRKLKEMGADIEYKNKRDEAGEIVADVIVKYNDLKGVKVVKEEVPSMIDELPLLAIVATQAEGETVITGAEELRVKESDRIKAIVENFKRLNLEIEELEDGMVIKGKQKVKGGVVDSYKDHRIAMGFAILGLVSEDGITIKDADCVYISYPDFFKHLEKVSK